MQDYRAAKAYYLYCIEQELKLKLKNMKTYTIQDVKNLEAQFGVDLKELKTAMQKGKGFPCPCCGGSGESQGKVCHICNGIGAIDSDTQSRIQVEKKYSLK